MQTWIAVLMWMADVVVISLGLAVFEILIEQQHGWGGRLNPSGWGRRLFAGTFIAEICEKSYLTVYHVFMFAFVVPGILYAQVWMFTYLGFSRPAYGYLSAASRSGLFLFLVSVWFSILVVEDALWFALNWYYPKSWEDLLQGRIWWHTRWITIGNIKLPRFYLTTPVVAVAFLILSLHVG